MRSYVIRAVLVALVSIGIGVGLASAPAPAHAASAGFNDWSCQPSAAHPEPVVLLHGLGASGELNFAALGPYLKSKGYCAYSVTYGVNKYGPTVGGVGSMPDSAAEVSDFVDRVLDATGAAKVSIAAHSAGSTVATYYLKFLGGDRLVKHFVGFGTNIKGSELDGLVTLMNLLGIEDLVDAAGCPACVEFSPRSDFMAELNEGGATMPGPTYTSIVTKYDEVVTPYTNGLFDAAPNVTNIVLQKRCPFDFSGHLGLAADPNVFRLITNALDPANARSFLCAPMPWVG